MSIKAYRRTLKNTDDPRHIERRLLSRATVTLEKFQASYDAAGKAERISVLTEEMKDALGQNLQIWMALKADLALPDNRMPPDLRAGLLSLAIWVGKQTQAVLGGRGEVRPLIQVNRNVIDGLGQPPRLQPVGA